ncbi:MULTISPECIES: hypothetical protein [unclassified Streptomyces]|uniref:hypothetical protein n=1 Tax=unclassified Streptomyces TaxID=2593676 RepID=UPI0036475641
MRTKGQVGGDGTIRTGPRAVLAAASANLALGIPAVIPFGLAWWVVTEYLPMDCRTTADLSDPGLRNCNYTTLDHAGIVLFLLAVTGVLLVGAVAVIDGVLPGRERRGLWLKSAVLVPVPFAVLLTLALHGGS